MKFVILLILQALSVAALFLFPVAGLYVLTVLSALVAGASVFGLFLNATPYALALITSATKDTLEPWKAATLSAIGRVINLYLVYTLLMFSPSLAWPIVYVACSIVVHANLGRERAFLHRMIRNSYGYVKA